MRAEEHPTDGPVVLITGALTGIGRATAAEFGRADVRLDAQRDAVV
jgi:NAD(P)-dependent dehydrogenase (short-subunit alcohol dehydrogenase family)